MSGITFYLGLYPIYQSYVCLKRPRVKDLAHWLIFWQIFWGLYFIDCVVDRTAEVWSWIPLSYLVWNLYAVTRIGFLIANYHPKMTYFSHKSLLKFISNETARIWKEFQTNGIQTKYLVDKMAQTYSQILNFSIVPLNLRSYYERAHAWLSSQYVWLSSQYVTQSITN